LHAMVRRVRHARYCLELAILTVRGRYPGRVTDCEHRPAHEASIPNGLSRPPTSALAAPLLPRATGRDDQVDRAPPSGAGPAATSLADAPPLLTPQRCGKARRDGQRMAHMAKPNSDCHTHLWNISARIGRNKANRISTPIQYVQLSVD
jgi:hypothetical protein